MALSAGQAVSPRRSGRRPIDVEVLCSCWASPLLAALFRLQSQWWWWPIVAKDSVLEILKQEGWPAAVRGGKVTDGEAEALGFVPPDMRQGTTVSAKEVLHRKTEPFHGQPTTRGRLRTCPACGRVPLIGRKALYRKAFDAVDRDEPTVYL